MAVEERDFDGDVVAGLLLAWANNTPWYEIDFGNGRWSDDAMTMYDRASGFTWLQIVERQRRIMQWWDDLTVYILEYPGGVEIPLWMPGHGPTFDEDVDDAAALRRIRDSVKRAVKRAGVNHPELAAASVAFASECLSLREPGFGRWATAKEWVRPGEA